MSIAKMHAYADRLDSARVGYDQGQRWSFNPARDGLSVIPNTECDCSSSCAAIARAGGYPLDTRDPIWTGNLREKLVAAGWAAISVKGKSLGGILATLRAGDILLGPGHSIYARGVERWWSAESDERGRASGGQAGDQTGLEARFRLPYMRSRGWEWILRPPAEPLGTSTPTEPTQLKVKPRAIEWRNPPASLNRVVQEIVGATVDGVRGSETRRQIKAHQAKLGIRNPDEHFGPVHALTYLLSVGNLYRGKKGMPVAAVKLLQWIVRSRVDGKFGPLTTADVKAAQAWAGFAGRDVDGNAGAATKRKIVF